MRRIDSDGPNTGRVTLETSAGRVRGNDGRAGDQRFQSLLERNRLMTVPVYDYVLMTEPLCAEQLVAARLDRAVGLGDLANQFHYYRRTADEPDPVRRVRRVITTEGG